MSFFTILFYFVVALALPIGLSITNSLIGGRLKSAWSTLRVYLVVVAIYTTALVATTLALPIQVLTVNEAQFSGDWSIAVASVRRNPHDLDEDYEIDFRLANRSTKVIQGEKRLVVYLLGEDGTRYNAVPDSSMLPFDTPVKPGKSVITTRRFVLPTNQNRVEMVAVREGFRLGWFIIGRNPFDGRTAIVLQ